MLYFENHVSHVTKTVFFHLRNIDQLRNMLPVSDAEKLVHAFMTSRLDYCNALLGGCPASSINKLQIVQNAAARVLTRSRKYDHITPILQSLHWLPIKFLWTLGSRIAKSTKGGRAFLITFRVQIHSLYLNLD